MRCPICRPPTIAFGEPDPVPHEVSLAHSYIDGVILNMVQVTSTHHEPQFKPGQRFWDQLNREHAHQTQRLINVFECSEGHRFRTIGRVTECPVEGCQHASEMRNVLDFQMSDACQGPALVRNRQMPTFDATIYL